MNSRESVELVRVLRNGKVTREVMPRWLAEMTIGAIPLPDPEGEPNTASAHIELLEVQKVNPSAPYPIKASTPERAKEVAFKLASFVTARLVA